MYGYQAEGGTLCIKDQISRYQANNHKNNEEELPPLGYQGVRVKTAAGTWI